MRGGTQFSPRGGGAAEVSRNGASGQTTMKPVGNAVAAQRDDVQPIALSHRAPGSLSA